MVSCSRIMTENQPEYISKALQRISLLLLLVSYYFIISKGGQRSIKDGGREGGAQDGILEALWSQKLCRVRDRFMGVRERLSPPRSRSPS
jgi:hypothetical protein